MSHHCHRQIEMKRASAFEEVAERSGHCSFCRLRWGGGVGGGAWKVL